MTTILVVIATVNTLTRSLGYLTGPSPLRLAPHGSLYYLFPFDFSDESTRSKDESADGSIFEVLCDKLELCPAPLYLIQQDSYVVLVPGEPVYGVGYYHVNRSLTKQLPYSFDTWPVQAKADGGVLDGLQKSPSIGVHVFMGSPFLGIQGYSVTALGVGGYPAVNDRP